MTYPDFFLIVMLFLVAAVWLTIYAYPDASPAFSSRACVSCAHCREHGPVRWCLHHRRPTADDRCCSSHVDEGL